MRADMNEDGTPVLVEAVYYRYHYIDDGHDTVEEGIRLPRGGEDYGSRVGVFVNGQPHSILDGAYPRPPTAEEAADMREHYAKAKAHEEEQEKRSRRR